MLGKFGVLLKMLSNSWFQKEKPPINLCEWFTDAKAKLTKMDINVSERETKLSPL